MAFPHVGIKRFRPSENDLSLTDYRLISCAQTKPAGGMK